ncbi:hypothetical protein [Rufibacter soli]
MPPTRDTSDNFGGLHKLWLTKKENLRPYFSANRLTLTKAQLGTVLEELPFITGDAYPRRSNGSNVHGPFRNVQVSLELKKVSAFTEQLVEKYEGAEVVALGLDHHGRYILYGQPDFPLEFSSDLDEGRLPADGQAYAISITGKTPVKSPSVLIS